MRSEERGARNEERGARNEEGETKGMMKRRLLILLVMMAVGLGVSAQTDTLRTSPINSDSQTGRRRSPPRPTKILA